MAYSHWDSETRGIFRRVAAQQDPDMWRGMDQDERNYARYVFDLAFVNTRVNTAVRMAARDEFWFHMAMEPDEFNWKAWRVYMGYDTEEEA